MLKIVQLTTVCCTLQTPLIGGAEILARLVEIYSAITTLKHANKNALILIPSPMSTAFLGTASPSALTLLLTYGTEIIIPKLVCYRTTVPLTTLLIISLKTVWLNALSKMVLRLGATSPQKHALRNAIQADGLTCQLVFLCVWFCAHSYRLLGPMILQWNVSTCALGIYGVKITLGLVLRLAL